MVLGNLKSNIIQKSLLAESGLIWFPTKKLDRIFIDWVIGSKTKSQNWKLLVCHSLKATHKEFTLRVCFLLHKNTQHFFLWSFNNHFCSIYHKYILVRTSMLLSHLPTSSIRGSGFKCRFAIVLPTIAYNGCRSRFGSRFRFRFGASLKPIMDRLI